jgi:UDP-N-acetylmuramyl pentapeptide synthase
MPAYSISKIAKIINGAFSVVYDKDYIINELAFDSRKIQHEANTLFFALTSEKNAILLSKILSMTYILILMLTSYR